MAEARLFVLDASVGVKWFKDERGSQQARRLYLDAVAGELALAAPVHFVHEVLSVVRREMTPAAVVESWEEIRASGISVVPLSDEVIAEAARQCDLLGCSFYDSLAPACAVLLDATLASADERAHGAFPGVVLVSE